MKRQRIVNLGNLLLTLSEAMDLSNPTISQHQYRTAYIALEIASYAGIRDDRLENIFTASLLHDIGALTVEEKILLHNNEAEDEELHTVRGEILLNRIPWLKGISKIVRNHHRDWKDWDDGLENPVVMASQIIYLSDYIERQIDRSRYILHQTEDIVDIVRKLQNGQVNEKIVSYFIDISEREDFWLDLVNPRLYSVLLHNGPFQNRPVGLDDILLISDLYRDLIDFKSPYTATHTSGVAECASKLSELFGFADIDIKYMRIAGNLHDIGKLLIPNSILEKPGKLTAHEYAIMRCHSYYTYHTIDSIGGLHRIAEWAAYHHERLDGSGYPFHYSEDEIGTGSRIMAVSDVFTALIEDRPYRKGMNKKQIYQIIKSQADNNLLDQKIVDLLFDNFDTIYSHVKEKQATARHFYNETLGCA
jgi:HD-GYP domain-containing protein (c-di-GMP phosphodiesterase class II)